MLSRVLLVLMVVSLVIVVVGCEGDAGPAGPAGAAGADGTDGTDGNGVLAWGEVSGFGISPSVDRSWPANVSATVTRGTGAEGDWTVDLTGTFPSAKGAVVGSSVGGSGNVALRSFIAAWSTTAISIDVDAWNTDTGAASDVTFTYVILEGD